MGTATTDLQDRTPAQILMAMQGCNNTGAWGAGVSGRQARRAIQLGTTRCALGSRSAARRVSLRLLFRFDMRLDLVKVSIVRGKKQKAERAGGKADLAPHAAEPRHVSRNDPQHPTCLPDFFEARAITSALERKELLHLNCLLAARS